MPTYDYFCPSCKEELVKHHSMGFVSPVLCPSCGDKCNKKISPGLDPVFKGSGFYETDYKRK